MMPTHPTPHELSVREMLPSSRHAQPEFEVSFDGRVIGYVRSRRYRSITFYEGIGVHNVTGEQVGLELSTDREERVQTVLKFWLDPTSCKQHLPWRLRKLHGLE